MFIYTRGRGKEKDYLVRLVKELIKEAEFKQEMLSKRQLLQVGSKHLQGEQSVCVSVVSGCHSSQNDHASLEGS